MKGLIRGYEGAYKGLVIFSTKLFLIYKASICNMNPFVCKKYANKTKKGFSDYTKTLILCVWELPGSNR